jgi:cytochrome bd-type quinol oxidase subunit 2
MSTQTGSLAQKTASLTTPRWLRIGLQATLGSILGVLLAQAAILSLEPELAAFKPLDSYPRSALFTFVPVMAATVIFARLAKTQDQPAAKFLWIAAVFLLLSFIPDFILPVPHRTLAASTAAASLHLVAGVISVTLILLGYNRSISNKK